MTYGPFLEGAQSMTNPIQEPSQSGYHPAMTSQPFHRTGSNWILVTALVLAVLAVALVLMEVFSGPDLTPAEKNYLSVVKQWPGDWPSDEDLVAQGHDICDAFRAHPELMTGAAAVYLSGLPSDLPSAQYQIGAAVGSFCTDQAWRVR